MILSGEHSRHKTEAYEMVHEVTESEKVTGGELTNAGHYLAEENPVGFAELVVRFVGKHD